MSRSADSAAGTYVPLDEAYMYLNPLDRVAIIYGFQPCTPFPIDPINGLIALWRGNEPPFNPQFYQVWQYDGTDPVYNDRGQPIITGLMAGVDLLEDGPTLYEQYITDASDIAIVDLGNGNDRLLPITAINAALMTFYNAEAEGTIPVKPLGIYLVTDAHRRLEALVVCWIELIESDPNDPVVQAMGDTQLAFRHDIVRGRYDEAISVLQAEYQTRKGN